MNMRSETGEIQANNTDTMFNNNKGEMDEHNRAGQMMYWNKLNKGDENLIREQRLQRHR